MYLKSKQDLQRHIERKHLKMKNFKCTHCDKTFYLQCDLDRHVESKHSEERKYKCKKCDNAFRTQSNLYEHMKSHTDAKPYPCPYCSKAYKVLGKLRTHVYFKHLEEHQQFEESLKLEQSESEDVSKDENNNQSAEDRHACPHCKKTYKYQKTLQNHIDKKHVDKPQI